MHPFRVETFKKQSRYEKINEKIYSDYRGSPDDCRPRIALEGHGGGDDGPSHRDGNGETRRYAGQVDPEGGHKGYMFTYHLIDMKASMPDMAGTYNLMVTITGAGGKAVDKAVVDYKIKGTDGTEKSVEAMAMGAGYGRNLKFSAGGTYAITTKALIGTRQVIDRFEYKAPKTLRNHVATGI
jgi:hypothetical protein